jgi:hypothetical protein
LCIKNHRTTYCEIEVYCCASFAADKAVAVVNELA